MKNKFKKKEKQVVNIMLTILKWKWLGKIISTLFRNMMCKQYMICKQFITMKFMTCDFTFNRINKKYNKKSIYKSMIINYLQ